MTTKELEELFEKYFNSPFPNNFYWGDELRNNSTVFLKETSQVLPKDLLKFLSTKLPEKKRYISYIVPIIDSTIYFEDIHYTLKYLSNPYKYLKDVNKAKVRLVRNIIKEFYLTIT